MAFLISRALGLFSKDVRVELEHLSRPMWSRHSCGHGRGCGDCEADTSDKDVNIAYTCGLLKQALEER